ncbi:MAG: Rrf2 family transcriptional regulator [Bacteroidales bacterium]|nr:Rrf2 family transcriptional regulator [Bacteroidales bacterium]
MKFSTKTRYGLRAMLEIAYHSPSSGIYQKDISINQSISNKYLDHIIHALKAAELIVNVKGKKSGYVLTRDPSAISIYDIHNAFEPGICVIDCLSKSISCDRENGCAARGFWGELNKKIVDYFKFISLEDLMHNEALIDDSMN